DRFPPDGMADTFDDDVANPPDQPCLQTFCPCIRSNVRVGLHFFCSEPFLMSSLCGRDSSMDFAQQQGHFLTRLAFAQAAVMLNPEAGCFRNDLLVRRESDAGTDLICFVRASQ